MQVTFSTLSKRRNSTKLPTGGTSYVCKLKDASSSLRPTIGIQWPGAGSPVAYNMCYIPTYGRYYRVDNWTYSERIWWADCSVDPLATYRTEIGAAVKYILRADRTVDVELMDGKYPPEFPIVSDVTPIVGEEWATDFSAGRYIVGVVGNGNTYNTAGGSYYILTAQELQALINACFTETDTMWQQPVQATTDLGKALNEYGEKMAKSIHNPAQFINSIYWVPFALTPSGGGNIILGQVNTGVSGKGLDSPIHIASWTCSIPMGDDPVCWANTEPYANYTLYFPPFGTFHLDSRRIWSARGVLSGYVITDVTNGESILEVYEGSGATKPLFTASGKLGTEIKISGSSVNYANLAQTQINAAGGFLGSVLRGDIAGAITGGASGIISSAQAGAATASNGGYGGGLATLRAFKGVVRSRMTVPEMDPTEQGVPVMDRMAISAAAAGSGYILCADGDIEAPATADELAEISGFLTGGFFYE